MGLTAKDKGGDDFEPIPEGMQHGICYGLYDLGTQRTEFQGTPKKIHQVLLVWELPEIRIDLERDGGETENLPRSISKRYTLSLHKKANLRKELESWRGKTFTELELEGFNLQKLLGVNCTLQIMHNKKEDRTYSNISNVLPLLSHPQKQPENPIRFFSFEDHTNIPEGTPDWISDIIKNAEEWGAGTALNEDIPYSDTPPDDDIPF